VNKYFFVKFQYYLVTPNYKGAVTAFSGLNQGCNLPFTAGMISGIFKGSE